MDALLVGLIYDSITPISNAIDCTPEELMSKQRADD